MMSSRAPLDDTQKSALVQQIITGSLSLQQACAEHGLSAEQLKDWVRLFRRTVRQAFDNQLRNTLSVQGLDLDELSRAEFSGTLEHIGVADLLQTIQMGRKDAHITVAHSGEVSEIWCRSGEVVDATSGSLDGQSAFYRILSVERGRIVADFSPVQRKRRITLSTPRLLLEAASQSGLWQRLVQRIGDPRQVFKVATAATARRAATLEGDELDVLSLFDGVRSVEEVVFASGLPGARALDIIANFRERNLLVQEAPAQLATAQDSPAPSAHITMTYHPMARSVLPASRQPSTWLLASGAALCSCLGAISTIAYVSGKTPGGAARPSHAARPAVAPALAEASPPAGPSDTRPSVLEPRALAPLGPAPDSLVAREPRCPANMTWIEAGQFSMGTTSKRPALSLARPAHRVSVSGFCLGKHEVTASEYASCVDMGDCTTAHQTAHFAAESQEGTESSAFISLHGALCNAGKAGREQHPINCVDHAQAARYCEAHAGRLPTEAEWEFAARGPEARAFPWGHGKPTPAHVNTCGKECERWHAAVGLSAEVHGMMYSGDDGYAGTAPVGSFPLGSTREGVEDLIGNVFEWTAAGLYDYDRAPVVDPRGPRNAESFVIRGGNFNSGIAEFADPALRFAMHRDSYSHGVGFRCASDAAGSNALRAAVTSTEASRVAAEAPRTPDAELNPGDRPGPAGSIVRPASGP
jgi:formylglycine-generating enzyme required for sulfatase activity